MNYVLLCVSLVCAACLFTLIYVKCIIKYTNIRSVKVHPVEIPVAQPVVISPVVVVPIQHVVNDHL